MASGVEAVGTTFRGLYLPEQPRVGMVVLGALLVVAGFAMRRLPGASRRRDRVLSWGMMAVALVHFLSAAGIGLEAGDVEVVTADARVAYAAVTGVDAVARVLARWHAPDHVADLAER